MVIPYLFRQNRDAKRASPYPTIAVTPCYFSVGLL